MTYLLDNNLFKISQTDFRSLHSIQTALLRVCNDFLLTEDAGECVILVLLYFSAALNTDDYNLLISRLERWA